MEIKLALINTLSDLAPTYSGRFPEDHSGTGIVVELTGETYLSDPVRRPEVALTLQAAKVSTLQNLAFQIRERLQNFRGMLDTEHVMSLHLVNETSSYTRHQEGSDKADHWLTMEFKFVNHT